MKRHIFACVLAMIMTASGLVLPIVAYASDAATMEVTLTLTEDDVTPPEPVGPDYIINIPVLT
jgi:hypothetical protein